MNGDSDNDDVYIPPHERFEKYDGDKCWQGHLREVHYEGAVGRARGVALTAHGRWTVADVIVVRVRVEGIGAESHLGGVIPGVVVVIGIADVAHRIRRRLRRVVLLARV